MAEKRKPGKKKEVKQAPEIAKAPKVAIVSNGDDWMGLYIDGVLVHQEHSIRPADVLAALGITCEEIWCDSEWLERRGALPDDLSEVKKEG